MAAAAAAAEPRYDPVVPKAAPLLAALAASALSLGCGARHVHLEASGPASTVEVRDARTDPEVIGSGRDDVFGADYDVLADGDLGPWLAAHVERELAAAGSAAPVTVTILSFDLDGDPWVHGRARYEVLAAGALRAHRVDVRTTELLTEGDDADWRRSAEKLGRWSAREIVAGVVGRHGAP